MAANGKEAIKTFERLWQNAQPHFARCDTMAPFIAPSRVGILSEYTTGDKQTSGVYDSTALLASELCSHFIAGLLFNPGQRWFDYSMPQQPGVSTDEINEINEWCQDSRDRTLRRCADSAFYAEGAETLIDWVGFGTGYLMCEENAQPVNHTIQGFRGFNFSAERTGRFIIQEGINGRVDEGWRKFYMTAQQISDKWSKIGKIPENVAKAITEGKPDRQFKIIHGIYPRPRGEQGYGNKGMPWASCWVENESKDVIFESGYPVFPASGPRYHRTPGEIMGRGRGDIAFPDVWSLNSAKRLGLEDHALKVRPAVMVTHDGLFGSLRLIPGGYTKLNTHGKDIRQTLMPFESGSRPEISNIKEEEMRKTVKMVFYVDHILNLMEVNKSEMTAFEFARKLQLLYKLIGPVYGRAELELLRSIVSIMFSIQLAAGDFAPPPPAMQRTNGIINVEFQNPLARMQRSEDAEALMLYLNDIAPLAQIDPSILDWLHKDNVAKGLQDLRGLPAKWRNTDRSVTMLRAARQQQQEKELLLQEAEQAANAANKAAPVMELMQGGRK
jgi:Bacteriophage head to tail connecting protein.